MSLYSDIYALRYGGVITDRVVVAIANAATNVLNEAVATANHTNRVVWAKSALNDAPAMAEKMMWAVCANASLQSSGNAALDSDIQFVINSLVDTFS